MSDEYNDALDKKKKKKRPTADSVRKGRKQGKMSGGRASSGSGNSNARKQLEALGYFAPPPTSGSN
jgi:hypothetical protein